MFVQTRRGNRVDIDGLALVQELKDGGVIFDGDARLGIAELILLIPLRAELESMKAAHQRLSLEFQKVLESRK
jgi:hypothetical protein